MSEFADEMREQRQAQMAAAMDAGSNEGDAYEAALSERGYFVEGSAYDPDAYEEPEQEWPAEEPDVEEYEDAEGYEEPSWDEQPQQPSTESVLADFNSHLDQLQAEFGVTLSPAERGALAIGSMEKSGSLNPQAVERLYFAKVSDARLAAEAHKSEQRRSKDPIVRRNARRAAIVENIEQGGRGL